MKLAVKVTGEKYYETHLSIVNTFLQHKLTQKEITVLAFFMGVDEALVEDDRFNSFIRKKALNKLELSAAGLSNYLNAMVAKKVLTKSKFSNRYTIKEELFPDKKEQMYHFKLINEQIRKENRQQEADS